MFFQKFIAFLAFGLLALVHAEESSSEYTVTVKTDVYSTELAYVTMTGEPPVTKPVESETPSYSVFTSVLSTEVGYTTGIPSAFTSHAASYDTTVMASVSPSASASISGNGASPTRSSTPIASSDPASGASTLQMSAGVAMALVFSVFAAVQ